MPVSEFNSQSPSQFCESRVSVIPRLSLKAYLVLTKILDCSAENGFGFKFASACSSDSLSSRAVSCTRASALSPLLASKYDAFVCSLSLS